MEEVKWEDVKPDNSVLDSAKKATTELVGMKLKAAKKWLKARDVECRVLLGEHVTADFRDDRVNLTVDDDTVTKVEVG